MKKPSLIVRKQDLVEVHLKAELSQSLTLSFGWLLMMASPMLIKLNLSHQKFWSLLSNKKLVNTAYLTLLLSFKCLEFLQSLPRQLQHLHLLLLELLPA